MTYTDAQRQVLTAAEVSAWLRIHWSTIYRMANDGRLKAFQVGPAKGGNWRFNVEDLREVCCRNDAANPAPPASR